MLSASHSLFGGGGNIPRAWLSVGVLNIYTLLLERGHLSPSGIIPLTVYERIHGIMQLQISAIWKKCNIVRNLIL